MSPVGAIAGALQHLAAARARPGRILLAVSGGPDSLALLLAAAGMPRDERPDINVATVDHGLRAEAAGEARFVGEVCTVLGLPHRVLRWDRPAGGGNVQAAAREARYRLLALEARRIGATAILTGHHRDDQVETHLMARERGALGPALAGMRDWRDLEPGLVLLRPFLALGKAELRALVASAGLRPVEDPTNLDRHYRRVAVRDGLARGRYDRPACLAAIEAAGLERRKADARLAEQIAAMVGRAELGVGEAGDVWLEGKVFDACGSGEAGHNLLSRILTAAGGGLYPPAASAVSRLAASLGQEGAVTLAGCRTERRGSRIAFHREYGRSGIASLEIGAGEEGVCWDRRFDLSFPDDGAWDGARVEAFGRLGRGNSRERTLPVVLDRDGAVLAAHPALEAKLTKALPLVATARLGWRIWADLPGFAPAALTAGPQIAANPGKPVGKDLTGTYLRGRVRVRAPKGDRSQGAIQDE